MPTIKKLFTFGINFERGLPIFLNFNTMKTLVTVFISLCFMLVSISGYSQTTEKNKAETKKESNLNKKVTPVEQQKQTEKTSVKGDPKAYTNTQPAKGNEKETPKSTPAKRNYHNLKRTTATSNIKKE